MSYDDWKPMKNKAPPSELGEVREGVTRCQMDLYIMRGLLDLIGTWANCTARCRRAKTCMQPGPCFQTYVPAVEELADRLATWTLLDGPRDPDDSYRPARDFFD